MKKTIMLAACTHFEPEIRAVLNKMEVTDVVLRVFPAHCGHPPMKWKEFREMASEAQDSGELHILGGCCLANLDETPDEFTPCEIHRNVQCFYMAAPQALVDAYYRTGAYLVTPGWLANWKDAIREWGFDQKTGTLFFQESMKKIVLLNTGTDPEAHQNLQEFSAFISLPSETVEIGTEHLRLVLSEIILKARLSQTTQTVQVERRQKSDYVMILDLIHQLGDNYTEKKVVDNLMDLMFMLFAPKAVYFQTFREGEPSHSWPEGQALPSEFEEMRKNMKEHGKPILWNSRDNSMLIHVAYQNKTMGILFVEGLQFPQYHNHYMEITQFIRDIIGLFISHARQFEELKTALEHVKQLSGLLPICSNCKKIRDDKGYWQDVAVYVRDHSEAEFSHGICPDCMRKLYPDYYKKNRDSGNNNGPVDNKPKK